MSQHDPDWPEYVFAIDHKDQMKVNIVWARRNYVVINNQM